MGKGSAVPAVTSHKDISRFIAEIAESLYKIDSERLNTDRTKGSEDL